MDRYPKRLIEVDLPIKRISAHARREKSIRHGHISTLHIWWARRPLAACRAVICASLWPDPADELCPEDFREAAFPIMTSFARDAMADRVVRDEILSKHMLERVMVINQGTSDFGPGNPNANSVLQQSLLDFIADFANWDASTNPLFLKTARDLTQTAHEALGGTPGTRPLVVDPFAGGGAIPLESVRVGADAFSSDLNPVAVLLNKVVLEYIPKYGQQLATEVRRYGEWVGKQAEKELAHFYPKDPDGATPIAYLWARTIISEAPGDEVPLEVPLIHNMWLAMTKSQKQAMRWVRDSSGRVKTELVEVKYADGTNRAVRRPLLEIFEPKKDSDVGHGTVARGSATCPVTDFTTPVVSVRRQLKAREGGAADARLLCIVTTRQDVRGRFFRLPTDSDCQAVRTATTELERCKQTHEGTLSLVPDEPLPTTCSGFIAPPTYGAFNYGLLFTPRQALALTTLVRLVRQAAEELKSDLDTDIAIAVQTCLGLVVDRTADRCSSLCRYDPSPTMSGINNTFARQALPMVWDFGEGDPTSNRSGGWSKCLEWLLGVIEKESKAIDRVASVEALSALAHPLPDDSAHAFITDPPYYNAVPYADLSDFFYVWLNRTIGDLHPELFRGVLSPKTDECCEMASWDPDRYTQKDGKWFEQQMTIALREGRRILGPDGVGVVVFAHKSTRGWEAMLQAMVDAGWVVTGSWPIDTEMGTRLRARNSAVLASSIHIVCRPRENPDGSVRTDDVGDWRDVLSELPTRIHEWMPRLAKEGVVGADAIFACLGPALEIFSRYSSVEKASGDKVGLKEYLEYVWAAVAREALNMIFEGADTSGFEEDARITAIWLWTLRTSQENGSETEEEEAQESEEKTKKITGYTLDYDAARKIAQGLGAHLDNLGHLVNISGDIAILLPATARSRYLFGKDATEAPKPRKKKDASQLRFDITGGLEEVKEESDTQPGELYAEPGRTILDQLHQSMILFGSGRNESLKRFLIDEDVGSNPQFWRLAQALSALYPTGTNDKRWVDGVLARKKGLGL